MRARGLPQTLGTASALLTCQALQHGNATAKWLLQPFGGGGSAASAAASSAAALQLPDDVVESCLLGRGNPRECLAKLLAASGSGSSSSAAAGTGPAARPTTTTANIVLAGFAARGCTAEALQLFDWMKAQHGQQARRRPSSSTATAAAPQCVPDWWTHHLLLFAALNAPKQQQLELTLRAVREAR